MASCAHRYEINKEKEEEVENDERERGLELGLGLGLSSRSSSSNGCKKLHHDLYRGHHDHLINPFSSVSAIDVLNPSPSSLPFLNSTTIRSRTHEETEIGLKLGLGLGFDGNTDRKSSVRRYMTMNDVVVAPPPNHGVEKMFSQDHGPGQDHDQKLNNDDNDQLFTDLAPSSSSSTSWAWRTRVFNDSHDYSSSSSLSTMRRSRPHSPGLWFTLLSSPNRSGEALPQIPKTYIRVKDENVTILMVKKYLIRKLGLSNEAETQIEISCMGENLTQSETLKQVRDTVWLPRLIESVNSATLIFGDSKERSINHLMPLHYGRRCG